LPDRIWRHGRSETQHSCSGDNGESERTCHDAGTEPGGSRARGCNRSRAGTAGSDRTRRSDTGGTTRAEAGRQGVEADASAGTRRDTGESARTGDARGEAASTSGTGPIGATDYIGALGTGSACAGTNA